MSKQIFIKYFVVLVLCVLQPNIGYSSHVKSNISELPEIATPEEVPFYDEEGKKHFLDEFENKTILLVFWATWCSSCTKEMPDLDALQKDFRKLPFEIVAVSQDYLGVKVISDYFKTHELRHLKIYHDPKNQLFKAFSVVGLPTSILINTDGKMVVNFKGAINWHDEAVREIILSHIPGKPIEPKNSYKASGLNQLIKRPVQKAVEAVENITEQTEDKLKEKNDEPTK